MPASSFVLARSSGDAPWSARRSPSVTPVPGAAASMLTSPPIRIGKSWVVRASDRPLASASFAGSSSRVVRNNRTARRSPFVVPKRTTR